MMVGIAAEEDLVGARAQGFSHSIERSRRRHDARLAALLCARAHLLVAEGGQGGAAVARQTLFLQKRKRPAPRLVDLADGNHRVGRQLHAHVFQ